MRQRNKLLIGALVVLAAPILAYTTWMMLLTRETDAMRAAKARADLAGIHTALQLFRDDVGRFPTRNEGLRVLGDPTLVARLAGYKQGGYLLGGIKPDPWKRPYRYCPAGDSDWVIVCTYGEDGARGGTLLASDVCLASRPHVDLAKVEC